MRIGIIPARLQTHEIHDGQKYLYEIVKKENDHVFYILGNSTIKLTKRNPIPFKLRKEILIKSIDGLHHSQVFYQIDRRSDEVWSKEIDNIINNRIVKSLDLKDDSDVEITLYGSRDSFIPYYSGVYNVKSIEPYKEINATDIRKEIAEFNDFDLLSKDELKGFAKGIIYSQNNIYPITFPTVDIIIRNYTEKLGECIILGRKPFESKFRFPGGFVDPTDVSLEYAARREAMEECGKIELSTPKYLGSFIVDDWRYKKEDHKIMTSVFLTNYIWGRIEAGDDLQEVKEFQIDLLVNNDYYKELLVEEHIKIFELFLKSINYEKISY